MGLADEGGDVVIWSKGGGKWETRKCVGNNVNASRMVMEFVIVCLQCVDPTENAVGCGGCDMEDMILK